MSVSEILAAPTTSQLHSFDKLDMQKFFLNILFFNAPVALLAILVGLQDGMHLKTALIVAGVDFLTSFIDLAKKYFKDNNS